MHGTNADYQQHDARGASLLWIEHSRLYVVSSTALCDGDTLPSKDTMLRFARALQIP